MKTKRVVPAFNRSTFLIRLLACVMLALTIVPLAEAGAKRKPSVLYLHSDKDFPQRVADVKNNLTATGLFLTVDTFDGGAATPTLAQLNGYDAVMVTKYASWSSAANLGTALAAYVDGGGGVVQTNFTTGGVAGSNLAGNWTASYNCIVFGLATSGSATLGTIPNQNHPIMIGVESFNGGTSSYRPNGTALTAGATLVASWSDGKPLVAVGPKVNRCDLGMFPPSGDAQGQGDLWVSSTDGVKLMANALLYVMRPKVLLAHADLSPAYAADVQAKIKATGILGQVDVFNSGLATPTLSQLQKYDAVLVWSSSFFANPAAMGNVMADYVDAGGGVVVAVFANSGGSANAILQGRWTGTYEIIPFGPPVSGSASLGAVAYASHPIMNGVVGFNGGTGSWRPNSTALNAGGLLVAKWSDGRTLAAVSTKMPNRADLGMHPPSSAVSSGYWVAGTTGDKLMANALLYTVKPYVACVAADPERADPVAKLLASRRFSGVGNIDANAATPALDMLSPFNAVATWSNGPYSNSTSMGNTLADYVDAGGGAVSAIFAVVDTIAPYYPGGRWITQGYEITPSPLPGYITSPPAFLGAVLEPSNPIASFVRKFDGNSWRQDSTPLLRGRTIMRWSDGKMLASVHNYMKRADLGYWPPSNAFTIGWNQRTDGTWMTANALEFVVRAKPCPGDFNGDGLVDDADFSLFVGYYNSLIDPQGDLTGDGLTEDADFSVFVGGYNTLICS